MVCHCLQVRESSVVEAITRLALTTLQEVRDYTSAGNGCNCCHVRLRRLVEEHGYASSSSPDICSVR